MFSVALVNLYEVYKGLNYIIFYIKFFLLKLLVHIFIILAYGTWINIDEKAFKF